MSDTNRTPEDLRKKNSTATWAGASSPTPWVPLDFTDSAFVNSLETVKNTFTPVVSAAKTVLEIVKTILEAAINLIVVAADATTTAIQAAIDAVRALLDDLLNASTFHTLVVPIGRTDLETSGKIMTDALLGGNPYPDALPISGEDLLGSGGNYGFLRTVSESLQDARDPNRPRYGQDAHIAAGVVVLGTTNLYSLYDAIDRLVKALRIPGAKAASQPTPHPRGLRAFVTASSYGTSFGDESNAAGTPDADHPFAVRLAWDSTDKVIDVDDAGNTTSIKRVVIYRAEDPDELDAAQPPEKWSEHELDSMLFDELTNEFYDNTIDIDTLYTYGVGFEIAVEDADGKELLSAVRTIRTVRVNTTNIKMPATRGVPPDWVSYNLLDILFPEAREFVEKYLVRFLDSLEDSLEDSKKALEEYVEFLESEINRYSEWAQNILSRINTLIRVLTWPDIYAGATMIYTSPTLDGGGGNQFFISQLAQALYDSSDPNRPPFDSGNEAVAGIVMLAGAETPGAAKKFQTILETFLGTASQGADSATQQALDSINYLTEQAERQICMSPAFEKTVCEDEVEQKRAFNAQFEPAREAAECAKEEE